MPEWTPASTPPKKTGLYLVWIELGDHQTYLSLAWQSPAVECWIEVFQGRFGRVLDHEAVRYWQPVPESPEDACQSQTQKS